jgi:hypothetical protein
VLRRALPIQKPPAMHLLHPKEKQVKFFPKPVDKQAKKSALYQIEYINYFHA